GRFALYLVGANSDGVGSLRAFPTAGGAERTLADASDGATPMAGARIAFTSQRAGTYPDLTADLEVIDLGGAAPATPVATKAADVYEVMTDDKTVVWLEPGAGLHLTTLP